MEDNALSVKLLLTGVIAAGSAVWGWLGWLIILWCLCMALDYITGSLAAMKEGKWSSDAAREGLWHKGGMIFAVLGAALTDAALTLILRSGVVKFPFDGSVLVTVIVLAWYTLTELGSMLENAAKLGDNVPPWLLKFLKIAKKTVDDAGEALAGKDALPQPAPPAAQPKARLTHASEREPVGRSEDGGSKGGGTNDKGQALARGTQETAVGGR